MSVKLNKKGLQIKLTVAGIIAVVGSLLAIVTYVASLLN
jgi:hypothetical protein